MKKINCFIGTVLLSILLTANAVADTNVPNVPIPGPEQPKLPASYTGDSSASVRALPKQSAETIISQGAAQRSAITVETKNGREYQLDDRSHTIAPTSTNIDSPLSVPTWRAHSW